MAQEQRHAGGEAGVLRRAVIMIARQFPKQLRFVGCRKILFGVMKADQPVATAVHDEHRHVDAGQLAPGVVANATQKTHRQERIQFRTHIGQAGEGALQDQARQRFAARELGGNAAAQ